MTTGGADKSPLHGGIRTIGTHELGYQDCDCCRPEDRAKRARPVAASARDNLAFHRAVTEVVEERISAGRERRDIHGDGLSRLHDALAMQLEALELDGRIAGVGDLQFDGSVGGQRQACGLDGAGVKAQLEESSAARADGAANTASSARETIAVVAIMEAVFKSHGSMLLRLRMILIYIECTIILSAALVKREHLFQKRR